MTQHGDFPPPEPEALVKEKLTPQPAPAQADEVEIIRPEDKTPRGRPPHEPSDAFRNVVTVLAGIKWSQKRIATCLKINDDTLRKYYAEELENGEAMLFADVVGKLMEKIRQGDTRAILYFLEKMNVLDGDSTQKALEAPRTIKITVVDKTSATPVKAKPDGK